jgi:hypothetical protein
LHTSALSNGGHAADMFHALSLLAPISLVTSCHDALAYAAFI